MKGFCLVLVALVLLAGCTSVPRVSSATEVEEGRYNIKISRDYANQPQEFKYAINNWAKEQNAESYDVEKQIRGILTDYYVTLPGSTPVEDMAPVKHFHKGKTAAAIIIPVASVAVVTVAIVVPYLSLMATAAAVADDYSN